MSELSTVFAPRRAQALASSDLLVRASAQTFEDRSSNQAGLFDLETAPVLAKPKLPVLDEWTPQTLLDEERAALGFYFSGHPLDDYERELTRLNAVSYVDAVDRAKSSGRAGFQMAGAVRSVRMRRSKTGNPFAWVEVSDATGEFEITVFSETLSKSRDLLEVGSLILMSVVAEDRDGETRFTCEGVRPLDAAAAAAASQLRVLVSAPEALQGVKRHLAAAKPPSPRESGKVVIELRLPETGREVEITLPGGASCTPAMRGALKAVAGVSDVELI